MIKKLHNVPTDNPLIFDAGTGRVGNVRALLEAGADVHANNDEALRRAAEAGHTDVVRLLLGAGADVHARDDEALWRAARSGRTEVVMVLLDAGADANNQEARRFAEQSGHREILRMLQHAARAGNDVLLRNNARLDAGRRAYLVNSIQRAISNRDERGLHAIIAEAGRNHVIFGEALEWAIQERFGVDMLIAAGATFRNGLWRAAARGEIDYIRMLIFLIPPNAEENYNTVALALSIAAYYGYADIVRLLLPVFVDDDAWYDIAMNHAIERGNLDVVRAFIEALDSDHESDAYSERSYHEDDPYASDNPIREALRVGNLQLAQEFVHSGFPVDNYIVLMALQQGRTDFVDLFLTRDLERYAFSTGAQGTMGDARTRVLLARRVRDHVAFIRGIERRSRDTGRIALEFAGYTPRSIRWALSRQPAGPRTRFPSSSDSEGGSSYEGSESDGGGSESDGGGSESDGSY
jgi:ankyrin repeat protein